MPTNEELITAKNYVETLLKLPVILKLIDEWIGQMHTLCQRPIMFWPEMDEQRVHLLDAIGQYISISAQAHDEFAEGLTALGAFIDEHAE